MLKLRYYEMSEQIDSLLASLRAVVGIYSYSFLTHVGGKQRYEE